MDLELNASKARSMNFWDGQAPPVSNQKELAKRNFSTKLEQTSYFEITDASLDTRDFNFSFELGGETYHGRAFVNQKYLIEDAIFRKVQIEDFQKVSIRQGNQVTSFDYQLNPAENNLVNKLFEKAILATDNDGDITPSNKTQPPTLTPDDAKRKRLGTLHLSIAG